MKITAIKTGVIMVTRIHLFWVTVFLSMLSCMNTGTEPTIFDKDAIIVQAYLYAGRPVTDVTLQHLAKTIYDTTVQAMIWNDSSGTMQTIDTVLSMVKDNPVDNAVITISHNGVSYPLTFQGSGRYNETSGNLVITMGQTYRIDIFADNRHVWAETTVPVKESGLSPSRDTIYIDSIQPSQDSCGKDGCVYNPEKQFTKKAKSTTALADSLASLTLHLNNPFGQFVFYRCYFDQTSSYGGSINGYTRLDNFRVATIGDKSMGITAMADSAGLALAISGTHKLIVYMTTPDYEPMLLKETGQNQDRWAGSPTNINNGLGFFGSFCVDSVFFTVVQLGDSGGGGGGENEREKEEK